MWGFGVLAFWGGGLGVLVKIFRLAAGRPAGGESGGTAVESGGNAGRPAAAVWRWLQHVGRGRGEAGRDVH